MSGQEGCDCTELCSMGPTCPGAILGGLTGSGCDRTHGLNHAPLPEGSLLSPGFCSGCDEERVQAAREGEGR